jgi:phospholipid/cholesterol/gamma-HCH transport system substrate-binding protein
MTSKAQRIRIGVFTLASAGLFVLALAAFGGLRCAARRDSYRILFTESVMGLEPGARVYVNGLRVGAVTDVALAPDRAGEVVVTIGVQPGTPVRADTQAMLSFAGITGLKVIDLTGGTSASPRLPPGGVIGVGESTLDKVTKQAEALTAQAGEILRRAATVVDNVARLTAPARFTGVDAILGDLGKASADLARTAAATRAMVAEDRGALRATLASTAEAAATARELIDGPARRLVGDAAGGVAELRGVIHEDAAEVRAALLDLRQASRSFKELARELRQRPSRLLFAEPAAERRLP